MTILQNYLNNILHATPGKYSIGIGLGESPTANHKIWASVDKICREIPQKVVIIGSEDMVLNSLPPQGKIPENLDYIISENPSQALLYLLFKKEIYCSQKNNEFQQLHAVIRGGLSSAKFLKELKKLVREDFKRLALLETADGRQFFFAPVGIDEATSYTQRKGFISETINFFQRFKEYPKIGVLSAGRSGDLGRDPKIDQNIRDTETLLDELRRIYPETEIKHSQILIEQAVNQEMSIIIAPDGISGNLIYRTLVHLGSGNSYGAIYLGCFNRYAKIIIDTSRVAPKNEYYGAIILGLGLALLKEKEY